MKRALLLTVRLYQRLLSPLLLPACRYVPTCSQYAHQAVELHGSAKGAMLAAWRLLRCHPLARGGYDPVPPDAAHARVADDRVAESYVAHAPSRVRSSCEALHAHTSHAYAQEASHAHVSHTHPVNDATHASRRDAMKIARHSCMMRPTHPVNDATHASRRDAMTIARHFSAGLLVPPGPKSRRDD